MALYYKRLRIHISLSGIIGVVKLIILSNIIHFSHIIRCIELIIELTIIQKSRLNIETINFGLVGWKIKLIIGLVLSLAIIQNELFYIEILVRLDVIFLRKRKILFHLNIFPIQGNISRNTLKLLCINNCIIL